MKHTPNTLYYHKTDGGAEYLCTGHIVNSDEGDLHTTIIRLDGEPELISPLYAYAPELLDVLKHILGASESHNNGAFMGEAVLCGYFTDRARFIIQKAEGEN